MKPEHTLPEHTHPEHTPRFGIPDDAFIRGTVPMTKQEIRIVALGLLDIHPGHKVLEIGSGTGAMTVEMARQAERGHVYSFDSNPEAITLSLQNAQRFECKNISLITGKMPEAANQLPPISFDRLFIGGSGGFMKEILETLTPRLSPGGKLVITALLMETVTDSLRLMANLSFRHYDYRMVSVCRGKRMGQKHGLDALNPITIITGETSNDR
jgi:cobalt-precorrin-6B (C15)-methyltransferase